MADNTVLNTGSGGDTIATDDIAGIKFQRVKIALGADGAHDGDVSSALPLPTSMTSQPLPTGAATEATLATLATQATLSALNTKTPALGSAVSASSSPVVIASDQVVSVSEPDAHVTGQGSQTALNNNVVLAVAGAGSYDASTYRTVALQFVIAAGTVTAGAITFEGSNDNTNFQAVPLYDVNSLTANPVTTYTLAASTNRYFRGAISFRYFRARISTGVTGTTTGVQCFSRFSPETFYSMQQTVTQATAANLNATVAGSLTTVSTVTTCSTLTTLANGQTAHSTASTGSPVRVGGRVKTAADITLASGDASDIAMTTDGAQVVKPYAVSDLDWSYAAAASGIVNTTTAVTVKAAAGVSIRNCVTGIQVNTEALGTATELAIRDGAAGTVLWRVKIPTAGIPYLDAQFACPLRGTANTLLEVVTLTASGTGAVYVNLQGYAAS